jgi:iron uptake system component EfeO
MARLTSVSVALLLAALLAACGDDGAADDAGADPSTDARGDAGPAGDGGPDPRTQVTLAVKQVITDNLEALVQGSLALQAAAPEPDDDGWNATDDAPAVEAMKAAWRDTRDAYERIEGAIAVLFPNYDLSTDERYDGFLALNGPDTDLFDGQNVTGVHAVERILWSDQIPAAVVEFESTIDGYLEARFPATRDEATRFKTGLCQRLVDDVRAMRHDFEPLALDLASAYRGVAGSLLEQLEKISLASTGEDESRYAQRTLADMRANLAGGLQILTAFSPLIQAMGETDLALRVTERLMLIADAYDQASDSDALPPVPDGWNPDDIGEAQRATPFGQLYVLLQVNTDTMVPDSAVSLFDELGEKLGIPRL